MLQTFDCPNCGAAVEYPGTGRTLRCEYCNTSIAVPEEVWQPVEAARTTKRWTVYLVIFLVVVFVVPTCVGLIGAVLGIVIPIFTALLGLVIQFFIH